MKRLLLSLMLTGCATSGSATLPVTYKGDPENFYCPTDSFAYCEGNDKKNMECICIDRREQRRFFERLQQW
jgi:hypothetical protein